MTTTSADRAPVKEQFTTAGQSVSDGLTRVFVRHRATLLWLGPVLIIAAFALFINMGGAPQRIDDEGTYTAQAYAVTAFGQLSHYTYWYDHPPLGWIQIAGYAGLTGAFSRYSTAVFAAREAVVVATLVGVVLLWALARKLGLGRAASAVAALIFALSPLAIQFHRTVYLDNIATPWLIAAFLLALSRRSQLASFAGSAACFSIAVLSKETFLLALPFLIWVMVRSSQKATRRYTLSVAGTILALVGSSYALLAIVKNELIPAPNRVSLLNGISFQLASRGGSGSVLDSKSLIVRTFAIWWQLDPVFIVFGIVASVTALFFARLRPIAAMMVVLVLFMFRPGGYLPVPYVIMLLPFAALLIAAVTERALVALRKRSVIRLVPIAWIAATIAALVVAAPIWVAQDRGLFRADLDQPLRSAESWIEANVSHSNRLIVDDSMWVDLVKAGWARDNVVWYYKVDTDPAVEAQSPQGWRDSDYVITTNSMRTFPDGFPQVRKAIDNSVVVASFGSGTQAVDIRRIDRDGLAAAQRENAAETATSGAAGVQLVANPGLTVSTPNRDLLTGGRVDVRIVLALGAALATDPVKVTSFPLVPGENTAARRQVLIDSIDGRAAVEDGKETSAARTFVTGLTDDYAPQSVTVRNGDLLLTYSAVAPTNPIS